MGEGIRKRRRMLTRCLSSSEREGGRERGSGVGGFHMKKSACGWMYVRGEGGREEGKEGGRRNDEAQKKLSSSLGREGGRERF